MSLSTDLTGRIAVITGASSGIGEATARTLAARGASVALIARRAERLDAIAADIRAAGGTALPIATDVTDADAVKRSAQTVRDTLGPASILFNNAGIMLPNAITRHRADEWAHQIDLNVTALVSTIGAYVDQLFETAADGGTADLINTSSVADQALFPDFAVYSATKSFVTQLTRHLRAELGVRGVRVGSIAPGLVATDLPTHITDEGTRDWIAGAAASMEPLQPEDIAEIVAFTISLPRHVNLQHVVAMPTQQAV